jgi:hypothetical protein
MTPLPVPVCPPRTIYILDTGVLYQLLRGLAGFGTSNPSERPPSPELSVAIAALLTTQAIVIPHVTLVEIVGQFFHTYINLADYDQWYRLRRAAFNPILSVMFDMSDRVQLRCECPRMEALNRAHSPISAQVLSCLQQRYNGRTLSSREPKFLDGTDALILDEAICAARANPSARCELLSGDCHLEYAVDEVRSLAATDARLPGNLYFRNLWSLHKHGRHKGWLRYGTTYLGRSLS